MSERGAEGRGVVDERWREGEWDRREVIDRGVDERSRKRGGVDERDHDHERDHER